MSSNFVPVFPLNHISYVVDRSITNPGDVLRHLRAFEKHVKSIPVEQWMEGPNEAYIHHHVEINDGRANTDLYKISLGSLEISIAYNAETTDINLQAFVLVPTLGTMSVGQVSGSLTKGVSVNIGFGNLITGKLGASLRGGNGYLSFDFTAFKKHLQGEVKIF